MSRGVQPRCSDGAGGMLVCDGQFRHSQHGGAGWCRIVACPGSGVSISCGGALKASEACNMMKLVAKLMHGNETV